MRDDGVRILDLMAFVQNHVRPAAGFEPAILRDEAVVGRHAYIERNISVPNSKLEAVSFVLLSMEAEGLKGRDPSVDFLRPKVCLSNEECRIG